MKKILIPFIVITLLVSTYLYWDSNLSPKAKLIETLKSSLNDPYSAKFESLTYFKKSGSLCGYVNAKNKFSAYIGNTRFVVDKSGLVTFGPNQTDMKDLENASAALKQAEEELAFLKLAYANCPSESEI